MQQGEKNKQIYIYACVVLGHSLTKDPKWNARRKAVV